MQADRINAAPFAAVTGANVNLVQHSTKQSQEALADPNHTASDGSRSNAVGPTEDQARGAYNAAWTGGPYWHHKGHHSLDNQDAGVMKQG